MNLRIDQFRFNIPKSAQKIIDGKNCSLDIYQSALLFHYLQKKNFIQIQEASTLSKIAHVLTGHSVQNIRTEKGFGAIHDIKEDKVKNNQIGKSIPNYNLTTLKKFLTGIVEEIDKQIEKNSSI